MLTGLKNLALRGLIFLFFLPFTAHAQSVLDRKLDFASDETPISEFLVQLESTFEVGFNHGKLPQYSVPARTYKAKSLRFILEDVLRQIQWYYQLVGEKSIVLQKVDLSIPGPYSISGIVIDSETGNSLEGVTVYAENENNWVQSNSIGYFQINLYYLPQRLLMYAPYYAFSSETMVHNAYWTLIEMKPNTELNEIVVKKDSNQYDVRIGPSKTMIDVQSISNIPSSLSSTGVVNALKYSAGFQSAVEANNAMIVRGGNNDQNLVLFDGVTVYNPLHVPGWFSIFNKDAISTLNLMKGGIPAKFGGRLSSVIQSESKKGSLKKWNGSVNVSPFAGEFNINGPLVKDKLSFTLSSRRTFTDFLISSVQNVLIPDNTNDFNLFFFDLNAGLHYQHSPKTSLDFVSYYGGDRGYIRSNSTVNGIRQISEANNNELLWSNALHSLSFNSVIGKRLSTHISAKYSSYGFDYQNNYSVEITDEENTYTKKNEVRHRDGIKDMRLVADFSFHVFSNFQLDFGGGLVSYEFVPANTRHLQTVNGEALVDTSLSQSSLTANEQFAYAQIKYQRKNLLGMAGLRTVRFSSAKDYLYLEPRLKLGYYPHKRVSFHFSYDLLRQNVYSLTANEPGITYSVWLPISAQQDPLYVVQTELSANLRLANGIDVLIAAYEKRFHNLPDFQTNIVDFLTDQKVVIGSGQVRGAELSIHQKTKYMSYWLSYTWSKSTRQFDGINNGQEFPFRFDRRHDLSFVASYKLNNNWTLGMTWILNSGNYVTLPVSRVILEIDNELFLVENFGNRNNFQLPNYHRLDLGLSKTKVKKRGVQTWGFTIYNVYNQHNPYYINLSFNEQGDPVLKQVNLLPFLPSVQYAFRF